MKKALITGITGQDGSYLAELLLKKATRFMAFIAELVVIQHFGRLTAIWQDPHEPESAPAPAVMATSLMA